MRLRTLCASLLGLAAAGAASAQTPAERDSIEQLRVEVAGIEDSLVLLDMESAMIEIARVDRDNALLHLKLGFIAFRLGEVTEENSHYDDAAGEFEWASELQPEWPYAWYGLGLAELAMGEHRVIPLENIRQALGMDYLSKAVGAFSRAAAVDPAFAVAVIDLANAAMKQKVRPGVESALSAVRDAASTEAADVPEIQLVRGRIERLVGDGDSAVAAFARYLEIGGDTGIGYFEMARSLYFVGQPSPGEAAYFRGASQSASVFATELYREDLGWVATEAELADFDNLQVEDREEWLQEFWRERDEGNLRRPGERLTEHHRRYFYALEHFPLVSRHRRYDITNPYRNDQQVFDDRGIIYVRHGEPDRVAYDDPGSGLSPNTSWLYYRPEQTLVFHFVAADDVQDYKLVESLADVLGAGEAVQLQAGGEGPPGAYALFNSRSALDPAYQRIAAFPGTDRSRLLVAERRVGERSIEIGTTTDAFPLRYDVLLDATGRVYVVGGSEEGTWQLLLVYAVSGSELVPEATGEGVTYRLGTRLLVRTQEDETVVYIDSTRVATSSRALDADQYLSGFLALPVPMGELTVRAVFDQSRRSAGAVLEDTVDVPDLGDESVIMSDLIIGREDSELVWVSGADTVHLTPGAQFPRDARLQVYYEMHGLERGAPYRSRLEVKKEGGGSILGFFKRLFGGGGPPISLSFDGLASGPTSRILQTVDITDLEPGRYTLKVTVEDPEGGGRFERESQLEVKGT